MLALAACAESQGPSRDPIVLLSVDLSPSTVALAPGASAQFTSRGQWSNGSSDSPIVDFIATGGLIQPSGLYTAGAIEGTYTVVARHVPSGLTDTATVSIVPARGAVTTLLSESFEADNPASRGWYDNTTAWTMTAAERQSGQRSLAWTWNQGSVLPSFGGSARFTFPATPTVYLAYWVKYSDNWVGSSVTYHPHEFHFLTNANGSYTGPSFTRLTLYVEHLWTPAGGVPKIGSTDGQNIDITRIGQNLTLVTETRSVSGCNGNSDGIPTSCYSTGGGNFNNGKLLSTTGNAPVLSDSAGPLYKGAWHKVEVLFALNNIVNGIGQLDGTAQYWIDGTLRIDRRDVLWRTGANPNMLFNQFIMAPYIQVGSPRAQSMWIDDLVVATGRP